MKLNRRYIKIIGATLISALILSGCAKKSEPPEEVEGVKDIQDIYVKKDYDAYIENEVLPGLINKGPVQQDVCSIDNSLEENEFLHWLEEIYSDVDGAVGKEVAYEGYVFNNHEGNKNSFGVGRYYKDEKEETLVGLEGIYDGKWPKEGTLVNVKGTIEKKSSNGEDIPVLKVEEIEEITSK